MLTDLWEVIRIQIPGRGFAPGISQVVQWRYIMSHRLNRDTKAVPPINGITAIATASQRPFYSFRNDRILHRWAGRETAETDLILARQIIVSRAIAMVFLLGCRGDPHSGAVN